MIGKLKDLDDAQTWGEFFRVYDRLVLGLARQRGLSDGEAEDVAQEVFRCVVETIHRFKPGRRPGSFRRWLSRLTHWRSIDMIRERGPLKMVPMDSKDWDDDTALVDQVADKDDAEERIEGEARRYLIQTALRQLERDVSPRQIQVFQLLVLEEWPVRKVCTFMKMNAGAVYVARHRVITRLREELIRMQTKLVT